jgi:GMP synthase (glutamine-hydrolysing)
MREILAIRHVAFEHLGTLEHVLIQRGYQIRYWDAGIHDLSILKTSFSDLLVVLGGPIGAYEENIYPFLKDELQIIDFRLRHELPILGICLGSQLIARALGAKVYRGSQKEIGWRPITLTDAGRESCLTSLEDMGGHVLHWHGDTFDLPEGATLLASAKIAQNQAFSWGLTTLGLQFHLEILPEEIERWLIGHACEIASAKGVNVPQLRADTQQWGFSLAEASAKCLLTWLDEMGL